MIYLTIIMLIVSFVSVIKGGLFSGFVKKYVELFVDGDEVGKVVPKENISDEEMIRLSLLSVWVMIIGFILLVIELIFLVCAMSIDVLIFPTLFVLTMFVGNLILAFSGKKKKKTIKELTTDTVWYKTKRILFLLYVIYIFILILI